MELDKNFEEACRLKNEEQYEDAVSLLHDLDNYYPNNFAVLTLLGLIYYVGIKEYKSAEIYLKKATKIKPNSELVSACLYHCLLELGREEDAINELDSFLSRIKKKLTSKSLHYKLILADLLQQEYALDSYWHILEKWYKEYPPSFLIDDEKGS